MRRRKRWIDEAFLVPGGIETARAFLVFGILLAGLVLVAGRLALQDLSLLTTYERLEIGREEASRIASAVAAVGQDAGGIDFARIRRNEAALREIVLERIAARPDLRLVEIRDRFGAPIVRIADRALQAFGWGASGARASDGRPLLQVVRVPLRPGAQPAGEVRVVVSGEMIERELERLRRSFQLKVAVSAAVATTLLLAGLLYVLHLIRKNRALEQSKLAAQRAAEKGLLASGLAHEIRNPLNAMNMNLQMLEEELQAVPGFAEGEWLDLLGSTKSEIKRLERLVNNFLLYARPLPPKFEVRDLNEILRATTSFLQADFRQSGVETVLDLEPMLPAVDLDEGQIKQAFLNVLVNARQVLRDGGRVRLRSRAAASGEVVVEIEDDGPGIPPEALEKVFEPFYSQRGGGTGLGLPIARQIVERHGGRLEVDSVVGRGTVSRIVLPRRHPRAAAPLAEPPR